MGRLLKKETILANPINNLAILWTSPDKEVAQKMVFLYAKNSKLRDWWGQVRLIIWGPSAKLLATDGELQEELEELKRAGVELQAARSAPINMESRKNWLN